MVSYEEGKALADKYGIGFFEVSAKSGNNVDDAYLYLARECKESNNVIDPKQAQQVVVESNENDDKEKSKGGCC